jgi:hypothetical protein
MFQRYYPRLASISSGEFIGNFLPRNVRYSNLGGIDTIDWWY